MKILVTGAKGLLAKHFQAYMLAQPQGLFQLRTLDHQQFQDQNLLTSMLIGCDVVVHFAGVNRGEDQFIYESNLKITQQLIQALQTAKSSAHVIFSSSTHIEKQTLYGQSKRECAALLQRFADQSKTKFTELILPHVFGEGGKPFYNSVVSTFCHQLAIGEKLNVVQDAELELIHCLDVSKRILQIILEKESGKIRFNGIKMKVSELKSKLENIANQYFSGIIPRFESPLELQLFNTLRSYLYPQKYPVQLDKKTDQRGYLFEAVKTENGGQGFLSITHPQITRGNHWHLEKLERFCVIQGQAKIRIRHILSNDILDFPVSGDEPCFIDIPTMHTHNITNTGATQLLTMFWSHEIFNPEVPDTFPMVVEN